MKRVRFTLTDKQARALVELVDSLSELRTAILKSPKRTNPIDYAIEAIDEQLDREVIASVGELKRCPKCKGWGWCE